MNTDTLDQRFATAMGQLLGPDFPAVIGLAVSGGGDSMAMLALARNWAHRWGVGLSVVTVDHGLRDNSAEEARMVAEFCADAGCPHTTLAWDGVHEGNTQDAARRARLALIGAWSGAINHVLMAHTADDQAETVLMRLARGSGTDGLSGMDQRREIAPGDDTGSGLVILRPCLEMTRQELRHYAKTLSVPWVEDPSNEDVRFDRVRMRQAMPMLAGLGITRDALVATAQRMQRASTALRARAVSVKNRLVAVPGDGSLIFDVDRLRMTERDTQMRLVAGACMWISSARYRPRANALEDLLDRALSGGGGTLIGSRLVAKAGSLHIFREFNAVKSTTCPLGQIWDGRWRVTGPDRGTEIRPLGEALSECTRWRDTGFSRDALLASPSVWSGSDLVAAPLANPDPEWSAQIVTDFESSLLSH